MSWRPAPLDMRVKNTFIDLPSGLTPVGPGLLTAPASLGKSLEVSLGSPALGQAVPHSMASLRQAACAAVSAHQEQALKTEAAAVAPWHSPREERLGSWAEASDDAECHDGSSDETLVTMRIQEGPERPAGALHPSIGSELHASGKCNKCCFFPRGKCANGYACTFCHYDHEKQRRRSSKTVKGDAVAAGGVKGDAQRQTPCCTQGHEMRSQAQSAYLCDLCGATGTAYQCSQGCDFDMCDSCHRSASGSSAITPPGVPLQLAQHVLLPSPVPQTAQAASAGFFPPPAAAQPAPDMVLDLLCRPLATLSCCFHGHALQPCPSEIHICDICRSTGTSYRCSQGCDFDMCELCHFQTSANAGGLVMPRHGVPQHVAWPGAPASQGGMAAVAPPPCQPPSLQHVASSASLPPPPPPMPPRFL